MLAGADALLALQLLPLVRDFTGFLLGFQNIEPVPGSRGAVQTENQCRLTRAHFLDALVALVEHGFYLAVTCTGHHHVSLMQCATLHQDGRKIAAALVERRLYDGTDGQFVRVGFQVQEFRFEQYFLQQFLYAYSLFGRNVLRLVFAAPVFYKIIHVRQLLLYMVGIGVRLIYLVDCENDGDSRSRGMVDRLYCLRHHVVIGSHYDNGYVGNLGTTRTHGCKRFVSRGIEECYVLPVFQSYVVSADMLGYASRLSGYHIGFPYIVEQRRFTVVDMAHYGYDRGARNKVFFLVFLFVYVLQYFRAYVFCFITELVCDDIDGFRIQTLVYGHHLAKVHASYDYIPHRDVHHRRKLVYGNKLCYLYRLAFLLFPFLAFQTALAFFFPAFLFEIRVFLLLALQLRQSLLYLL